MIVKGHNVKKLLAVLGCFFSCQLAAQTKLSSDEPRLRDLYKEDFSIGVAVQAKQFEGAPAGLITRHFNRLSAEFEMKWAPLLDSRQYNFAKVNHFVQFSQRHQLKLTGHTLIWHIDNPSWLFTDQQGQAVSKSVLRERMRTHIFQVMGHLRGHVDNWDVANEVLSDRAGEVYRQSEFYKIYGDESYLIDAYRFAAEADPQAELWYNDYMIETPEKLAKLLQLIRTLKSAGIKLTGIGFQSHYNLFFPSIDLIDKAFQAVLAEGLKIKVSELDVTIYSDYVDGNFEPEPFKYCDYDIQAQQAQRYRELFQLYQRYRSAMAHVTIWGLTDDQSWLNSMVQGRDDCPLLFDRLGQGKPALQALMEWQQR